MRHPDESLTARASRARQDLKDALFLVGRAEAACNDTPKFGPGPWPENAVPLTDEDRNNLADALDALNQLVRALSANGHPSVIEARPPDHVHIWKVA